MSRLLKIGVSDANTIDFTKKEWYKQLKEYKDPQKAKHKKLRIPHRFIWEPKLKSEFQAKPKIIGVDCETYENGNILCFNTSVAPNDYIVGYDYQPLAIHKLYDFLANHVDKNVLFVAWNMKFDATAILKGFDDDNILKEFKMKKDNETYDILKGESPSDDDFADEEYFIKTDEFTIDYLPKKLLKMKKHKTNQKEIRIFDGLQFFKGEAGGASLDNVAKAYKEQLEAKGVKHGKEYDGKYKDKRFPMDIIESEHEEFMKVKEYCYKDCVLAKHLVDIWLETYHKNFGFYPPQLFSTGYITALYLKTVANEMFMFGDAPYEVQDAAYRAYFGGRFEEFMRGYFEDVFHYDINSAYPAAMVRMPDFMRGKWIHIKDLETYKKYSEYVGFYQIETIVKDDKVAPFLFRDHDGTILCPKGYFITNTTSMELNVALKHYDCKILKLDGYAFIPGTKDQTEFGQIVQQMYDTRLKFSKKDPVQKVQNFVYKVLINSLYGKFAQHKPQPRGLFNPIVCSYITGSCRAQMLEAMAQQKDSIIMAATDGIFSTKKLDLDMTEKKLGSWEYEHHPDMVSIMAGIYQVSYDEDEDYTKTRGFGTRVFTKKLQDSETKFSIKGFPTELVDDKLVFKFEVMRPVSISEAVIQHKYSIKDLCRMEFHTKEVNINGDNKRVWDGELKSIYDFNDSETRTIGTFK